MRPKTSVLVVAFVGITTAVATGCSGAGSSGITGSGAGTSADGLPCCHDGYIYKCASESALNACSDRTKDETTDCTKTSTACGGGTQPPTPPPGPTSSASSTGTSPPPPPPPKSKTGEKCNDPSQCEGDQCLVFGAGTAGFCSNVCASNSQCPTQFRCQLAEKLGVKVCVPFGEAKLGDSCALGADCASGLCFTGGGVGYCSATCNVPADCGLNWQCAPVAGSVGKFCLK